MHTVISTWTDIIQQFFPIFTAPGAEIFSRLTAGWILCTARRTITGIIPFADPCFQRTHGAQIPLEQVVITKIEDGTAPASIFID